MWFKRDKQDEILLKYLPKGRVYKQAHKKDTNFNKIIQWLALEFQYLIDKFNLFFRGLFVCEGDALIDSFKKDYNIPNKIFYNTDIDEHRKDIYVLKYLMKGNTAWHFKAIANIYGYDVDILSGKVYFKKSRIPNTIPHKLYSGIENVNNVIVVIFYNEEYDILPHSIPHKLGSGLKISKIKQIFDIIKQSQTKILYMRPFFRLETKDATDYIPTKIPHKLGKITVTEVVYEQQVDTERVKLCIGEENEELRD